MINKTNKEMKTLRTKNGTEKIGESITVDMIRPTSNIFKAVEAYFWNWFDGAPRDIKEMYSGSFEELGGASYLSRRGAIEEGIAAVVEYVNDSTKQVITTREFYKVDLEGIFEA